MERRMDCGMAAGNGGADAQAVPAKGAARNELREAAGEMEPKTVRNSKTTKAAMVLPPDTNHHGTLFGGKLMAYIDDVATMSATRHARRPVVTASTDSVDFLTPVRQGDSVCLESYVTWAGTSSMEVFVKVVTEHLLTGERNVCTTAFLTFVALDENGRPTPVPRIVPETDEEIMLHSGAPARMEQRKARRKESRHVAEIFGAERF